MTSRGPNRRHSAPFKLLLCQDKPRCIDQHRSSGAALASGVTDGAHHDKGANRADETRRHVVDRVINSLLHRKQVFVVFDHADMLIAAVDEDLLRTDIIGRRIKADTEVARKQVVLVDVIPSIGVNKYVGEVLICTQN